MADELDFLGKRLEKLELRLDQLHASMQKIESRIELIQQEFQRSATQLHRLGLNQESAKHAAQRHEDALKAISAELREVQEILSKG